MKNNYKKTIKKYFFALVFFILIGLSTFFLLSRLTEQKPIKKSSVLSAETILQECTKYKKEGGKLGCYGNIFYNLAIEKGHYEAFKILLDLQKMDSSTLQCHLIAHQIGRGTFINDTKHWKDVIVQANQSCGYGVAHGVIEQYLSSLPQGNISNNQILLNICDKTQSTGCRHIIGHLLMVEYKGNVDKSLEKCKIFSSSTYIRSCAHGVFMEQVEPRILVEHGLADKNALNLSTRFPELVKLCENYKESSNFVTCWGRLARAAMFKFKYNAQAVLDFCNSTSQQSAAKDCRGSAVNNFVIQKNLDLQGIKYICKLVPSIPEYEKECYHEIAATGLTTLSSANSSRVVNFCSSLESRFQGDCYSRIGITLKNRLPDQEIAKICSTVPEKYYAQCI